ncbi:SEC-C domain-containing protein [Frankia sp. AgB1.9]|uniref:SEC-C metal-binding domain-containing protein n=1 Tax=unclassified Frankia TaxID=2632575 RepID=UPI001934295F|nr:SEC-C domain-containing protein [Frankia sp. AgW1.1]MBL7550473.1 SEC-C domain-containing protein [Frankia sp. AgB1.9]MBL7624330.1 SEC-C domain-containing protein [Frankia sp. AgB1.8]
MGARVRCLLGCLCRCRTPRSPYGGAAAVRRRAPSTKPRRDEPCWCGSGQKYKRCHLRPNA